MIARELLVKLGFDIDEKKINHFSNNINHIKAQMSDLRDKINQQLYPKVNLTRLAAYKKELEELSHHKRLEILKLNREEQATTRQQIKNDRGRYAQLQAYHSKLLETKRQFDSAARSAIAANRTFSRYFTRFALIGSGSFLLSLRNTLKDAQNFKEGGLSKTNNFFSKKQIVAVDRFNSSLKQTRKSIGELRNGFIIDLLPSFLEYLDAFNIWIHKNRQLINSKFQKFAQTLGSTFKFLSAAVSSLFSILNPLVDLIGGWGVALSGVIGLGVLSWLTRLALFLKQGGAAIMVFAGALRVLTVAMMTNPLCLALTAIAGAAALIADEFIVTARGGDSLMNRFSGLKKVVDNLVTTLKTVWEWIVKLNESMFNFLMEGGAKDMFNDVVDSAKEAASSISGIFGKVFGSRELEISTKGALKQENLIHKALLPDLISSEGLNVTYATEQRHRFASPSINNHSENNTKNINVDQKPSINITINGNETRHSSQKINIVQEIKKQVQAELEYSNEKLVNAIGAI